jgi:hypothetical protein
MDLLDDCFRTSEFLGSPDIGDRMRVIDPPVPQP